MQRPLGAQISHMLKERGVDVIFGIPGVHNVELYRGIEDAGITHIIARHEQGAGFMADGYARATGKPGVAYVITGPGLCNIMTPMGQASSDSVPMLVISSCLETKDLKMGRRRLHEMKDQEAAAATVCDWSVTALDAEAAYHWVDRALAEFALERPRAKHLQVPIDVLGAMAGAAPAPRKAPEALAGADAASVAKAAEMLAGAQRPLFILGGGAVGAVEEVRAALSRLKAASFMTYAGRGIAAADDALSYGSYLARPESAAVIGSADVVLILGSELSETDLWRDELGTTGAVIRVDIDGESLSDRQEADLTIKADAAAFMSQLLAALHGHKAATVAADKARYRLGVEASYPGVPDLADAMGAALPEGCQIFSDMTTFAYAAKESYAMDRPGHWHHPFGFGTLGYALPAAMGAKIGLGDAPVIAIAGDYGFQYTLQELGLAVELGLSLPILLWDNQKLMAIESAMVASQIAPNAVLARNPDFSALAEAYGARAARPGSVTEMQDAIRGAFDAPVPTLIHVTAGIG